MFLDKLNEVLASKNSWRTFVSDRLVFFSLAASLLINIIQWVMIYIKIKPGGQNILLHYNIILGTDLVDRGIYAYLVPGLALLFLIVNVLIANYIFQKEKLAGYFLAVANLPVQAIFLVASIVLILANN